MKLRGSIRQTVTNALNHDDHFQGIECFSGHFEEKDTGHAIRPRFERWQVTHGFRGCSPAEGELIQNISTCFE